MFWQKKLVAHQHVRQPQTLLKLPLSWVLRYTIRYGAEFKLDVGLYRLDQQVACQRYRQNPINAKAFDRKSVITELAAKFAPKQQLALAA